MHFWFRRNAAAPAIPELAVRYGAVPLDSFGGGDDDAKLTAALAHAKAQTVKPTIVFPNRKVTLKAGPWEFFPGLRISGPIAAPDREFGSTSQCPVTLSAPMFRMPGKDVRDLSFRNLLFRAGKRGVAWMEPVTDLGGGPTMCDAGFRDIAWTGFASVMHARHLRCSIERMYCNNGTGTQFKLAGSDNYYWTEGCSFLSGDLPAAAFYIHFTHMSRTRVGGLYITPQHASALRLDGTYGNLTFDGVLFDSTGRTRENACQGSAVLIRSGEGYVFRNCWFFNNAVAPSSTGRDDKGQVHISGPAAGILFESCQWGGGARQRLVTPAGTPALYCGPGVTGVRVSNPLAPNKGEKRLQQAAEDVISCDDPSWKITTAS